MIRWEEPGFVTRPDFVAGVQVLAEFDLSFDICILSHQLGEVIQLVEQCPSGRFVLDHLGKPDVKGHVLEPWREQLATSAAFPNVSCKLSGLVTEADHRNWTRHVAQMATMGPAFWREYTGDPAVFYSHDVGPVVDLGVYMLTLLTGLLGPTRRVQAMVTTAIPERIVLAGPHAGRRIAVEGYDHALTHLELSGSVLVQLLASFAVPATQMPLFEIVGTTGTLTSQA